MGETLQIARRHLFVAVPFLFYGVTCAPGIGMSDTAILIGDMRDFRISAAVNSHNLSVLLGSLFLRLPFGSLAFRGNLMSVFCGGLAVALFYALLVRCFRSRAVAAACATLLMVSHSMWWHSTLVESYAINACLVVLALHLLVLYRERPSDLPVLALVGLSGISIFHHAQLGVLGLATIVVFGSHLRRIATLPDGRSRMLPFLARVAIVAVLSLVPYGIAVMLDSRAGAGVGAAVAAATGGPFRDVMFQWAGGIGLADTILLTLLQFPSPFLLLIPIGLLGFLKDWGARSTTVAVLTIFVTTTGFFLFFQTWDRFAFLLVSFIVLAFWGAFAVDQLVTWAREEHATVLRAALAAGFMLSALLPPLVYRSLPSWGVGAGSAWARRFGGGESHTIDAARYVANPWKRGYREIDEFAELLFQKLPPNALYLDDDAFYYTLEYFRIYEGRRPDLGAQLVNAWGFGGWGLSPETFTSLLEYAHDSELPLFLSSLEAPFDEFLQSTGRQYRFAPFPLDDRHSVFRLATAQEDGVRFSRLDPAAPVVARGIVLARGKDAAHLTLVTWVDADEPFVVGFEFEESSNPFPMTFRWIDPSGRPRFSSPLLVVPPGSRSTGWMQERKGVLSPGRWRVEVWVGPSSIASAVVEVRRG